MRKLATAAISFSIAVFAANYILKSENLLLLAIIFGTVGLVLALLRLKWLKRPAIIFFSLAVGFVAFWVHNRNTVLNAEKFDAQTHMVEAQILTYPEVYDDYCRLEVRVTSDHLPNLKAYLYDNDKQLSGAKPGDSVSLRAKLSLANTLYGEEYRGYYSKGVYLKISSQDSIKLEPGRFDIFLVPQHISHWLSSRIEDIFPDDTEVFMRSLMLGDKTDFYGDESLYVSMSRAGLMHIVAVSGMHISFLIHFLYHIFGKGKYSAIICLVLVWLFALVTGFGPSVVRAAFMCSTMLMTPVLRRENDNITSLSAVLAALLFVNPFAAASVSLQLSFAAMAGIVLLGGKIYRAMGNKIKELLKHKLVRSVLLSISSSLSVMVFTIPLIAIHFGTVPLLSPITNLLNIWAVSACFCGGWISCALSVFPFLGEISAWLCSWLARYIFFTVELISSIPFAVLYASTKGTWLWIGFSYAVFVIFAFLGIKGILKYVLPTVISYALVAGVMVYNIRLHAGEDTISFLDVGQGQCVTVLTEDVTAVFDCGNTYTIDDPGMIAAARLYSRGRTEVDFLFLSHLHADHANGAVTLMESIKVNNLVLPSDYDDSDALYNDIVASAKRNGTKIINIDSDTKIDYGDIGIKIYKVGSGDDENERCLISKIRVNETEFLFLADSTARMQRELAEKENLSNVDVLLVSHHGSKYSYSEELLAELEAEIAVISVGNNYYGHPSDETLEALKRYRYNVYRTDVDETIQLTVGN